jgi:hypothetical protein
VPGRPGTERCRIDLYEIKARLRRANGLRAALRAILGPPIGDEIGRRPRSILGQKPMPRAFAASLIAIAASPETPTNVTTA